MSRRAGHKERNLPAPPFLLDLRCSLVDVSSQVLHIAPPTLHENLDVIEIELEKFGKFLCVVVSCVENVGKKKFHDPSGREAILLASVPFYKDRACAIHSWS